MDAGAGGPDSGIDTGSPNFCGFHSPRDHTTSETSGADVTDIVSGEDIPFDEVNGPRSFDSTSEFNVWHSSHKPSLSNDNGLISGDYSGESLGVNTDPVNLLTNNRVCSEQIVPEFEADQADLQCDIKNKNGRSDICFDIQNRNEYISPEPLASSKIICNPAVSNVGDYNWQSGTTTNNNGNHYFIDASSLLDDSELAPPLPPKPVKEATCTGVAMSDDTNGKECRVGEEQTKTVESPRGKKCTWSGSQNIVAEFERELTLATHLEPLSSTKKTQVLSADSSWSNEVEATGASSNKLVDSFGTDLQIVPSASHDELNSSDMFAESELKRTDQRDMSNAIQQQGVEGCAATGAGESNPPTLIRQKTFELDADDQHLTLLRQDYERRQGNLLFQSSILQFSTHHIATGLGATSGVHATADLGQAIGFASKVLHSTVNIGTGSNITTCEGNAHTSASQNLPVRKDFILGEEEVGCQSNLVLCCNEGSDYTVVTNSLDQQLRREPVSPNNSLIETTFDSSMKVASWEEGKKELGPEQTGIEVKLSKSCCDISSKPVLSGAFCPSDLLSASERISTDSPKRHMRMESTPILSGGVSCIDFTPLERVSESPIMSRRKNEFAPILSGAAPVSAPEPAPRKTVAPSVLNSSWVVDMGQCPPKERRKSEGTVTCKNLQAVEIDSSQETAAAPKTAPLGFYIDLNKISSTDAEGKTSHNKKVEPLSAGASSNLGFFIDFSKDKNVAGVKSMGKGSGKEMQEEKLQPKPASKNACGFFIDLSNLDCPKKEVVPTKRVPKEEIDDSANKKNTLFSMFIDISDSGSSKTNSLSEVKNQVNASPHLSIHRKLKSDKLPDSKQDPSNIDNSPGYDSVHKLHLKCSDSTTDCTDLTATQHPSNPSDKAKELEEKRKQGGVYMYLEPESPIARRKTLPSGVRPAVNRHSWNPEARNQAGHVSEEPRRKHKRAHSLSVDCKLVAGDDKTSSSTSLSKSRTRGSSQSLQEATSPEQTSLTQFSDLSSRQISSSSYSRPQSKTYDKLGKRLSYEGKTDSERDLSDLYSDTISEGKMINEEESQVTDIEMVDDTQDIEPSDPKCKFVEAFDLSVTPHSSIREVSTHDESVATLSASESDGLKQVSSRNKANDLNVILLQTSKEEHSRDVRNETSCEIQEITVQRELHKNEDIKKKRDSKPKMNPMESNVKSQLTEVPATNDNFCQMPEQEEASSECFVKLSDLDKESKREESSVMLPSFASANRMTRSIPETSWIESKLSMTRSIGGGTTSRSLSRLFPHLHSTMMTTSGGSLPRSKSPAETESELSDISSMQSSMAASGMEASTEETDTSLSRGPGSSRLGEDLLRMFLEEISPDVTIDVGGRRIRAHKCILSSRCQYFAAVLSGGWVQSAGDVISLQGFSYNAVFFALCHIYSGTNNIPDTISIVELATLSDMLALEGLKEVIMFTLKSKYCHFFHKPCTMCAVGVLECLPLAAAYGLDDIYRKSLRWITKHFVRIWPTKGFATLPRELIDKCYQQHVINMMPDNILETVMCCDKLLATLPSVRWAEPVFAAASQLLDAAIRFTAHHFSSVLDTHSFLSLSKELSWNISRLEESLTLATERLPPDQACQSYSRLHQMLDAAQNASDNLPSPSFLELLRRLEAHTEDTLVRIAPRACRCSSWGAMDAALRKHIQEVACLVIAPVDEAARATQRASRHNNQSQARSISGSRNLDLRQVKLAMTQQARRAASGGRVSTLRADTKPAKKSQPIAVIHPQRLEQAVKDPVSGDDVNRPKAWQLQVFENPSHSTRRRAGDPAVANESPSMAVEKTPTSVRRKMISSSDSSRTSSPAMRRPAAHGSTSRSTKQTAGVLGDRPQLGSQLRHRQKEAEVNMSKDSLAENVEEKLTPKCATSVRPDPPSMGRRKQRVEMIKVVPLPEVKVDMATTRKDVSTKSISNLSTMKKQVGRIADETAMSSDSLATEASYTIDEGKSELRLDLPTSPLVGKANRGEAKAGSSNAKRVTRAPLISPRESNTSRLRSAAAAASLQAAHSKTKSLATKSPTDIQASPNRNSRGKMAPVAKAGMSETVVRTTSPGSSVATKRSATANRLLTKQSVVSPAKMTPKSKPAAMTPSKEAGSPKTTSAVTKLNITAQVINHGTPDRTRNKQVKKIEVPADKVLGSRSGTFLKDEPTVLKKPTIENVQE